MDNFDNAKSPKKHSGAFNPSRSLGIDRAHYVALEADDPAVAARFAVDHLGFFLVNVDKEGRHYLAIPIHSSTRAAIKATSTTSPISCTISMTCWRQSNC